MRQNIAYRVQIGKRFFHILTHHPQLIAGNAEQDQRDGPDKDRLDKLPAPSAGRGQCPGMVIDAQIRFKFRDQLGTTGAG